MNQDLLGLAFGAGLVAALNPCGFAMLPAYLALVVRGEDTGRFIALARALAATAAMAVGFVAVFGVFGVLTVSAASTVQRYLPYVTVLVGIVLVALGIWLVMGRELIMPGWVGRGARWAPTARLGSMFGYGVSYAIASLSCTVGPFLAVTGASLRGGTILRGVSIYLAYAAGITLVVGTLAVATAFAGSALTERMRRVLPFVNRLSGALLIVVGLYVGYYGVYEVRLFETNGSPQDPVLAAAGRLQGALAGWVYRHSGWPWLAVLVALLIAGSALAWRGRGRKINPFNIATSALNPSRNTATAPDSGNPLRDALRDLPSIGTTSPSAGTPSPSAGPKKVRLADVVNGRITGEPSGDTPNANGPAE